MSPNKTFFSMFFMSFSLFMALVLMLSFKASDAVASDAIGSNSEIEKILAMKTMPDGVVFEVVSGNEDYLKTALNKFELYQKKLKAKFPDIDLAIVTHGSEQFSLTRENKTKYADTHKRVQRISDSDVPVHICETHASWRDITAEDFPDYVNVSAQGPIQIRQYQELGYILIIL